MAGLISPHEAAVSLGISEAMLRQLASDRYYAYWLEAPRDERNYRSYTERDMALLRHVLRTERRGIPHKVIRESLQSRGVDAVLSDSLGAEELNPMLQAQNARLLNENAVLVRERESWLQERQRQQEDLQALKDQVRDAEQLAARVRLAGYAFAKDAEERISAIRRSIASMDRELVEAEEQYRKAVINLKETREQLASFWTRLLRGGALSGKLAEALVRLETADQRRQRVQADFANLLMLADGFILGEIQSAVQLPAQTDDKAATGA
jgi:DNA-binding transcriptional MerR regulator